LLGAQLGETNCSTLLVAVHQQYVSTSEGAGNGQVDGEGCLAYPAFGVANDQDHAAAPIAEQH